MHVDSYKTTPGDCHTGHRLCATEIISASLYIVAMKIWFWMQMEKYVLLRELKRLEAQVARLVER